MGAMAVRVALIARLIRVCSAAAVAVTFAVAVGEIVTVAVGALAVKVAATVAWIAVWSAAAVAV